MLKLRELLSLLLAIQLFLFSSIQSKKLSAIFYIQANLTMECAHSQLLFNRHISAIPSRKKRMPHFFFLSSFANHFYLKSL